MPIGVMKSEFYIQAPFATDTTGSEGYDKLKNLAEHQEQIGRTCIVSDAMHTRRCNSNSCKPSLCRGDLASQCSDALVTKELLEWARERDNGNPRCTGDLEDTQFADITGGIAESHHLGRCVDAAFVGTEEAKAESKGSINGIGNFRDEVVPDDTEAFDDEQDLLDKTLLPGSPSERTATETEMVVVAQTGTHCSSKTSQEFQVAEECTCAVAKSFQSAKGVHRSSKSL